MTRCCTHACNQGRDCPARRKGGHPMTRAIPYIAASALIVALSLTVARAPAHIATAVSANQAPVVQW